MSLVVGRCPICRRLFERDESSTTRCAVLHPPGSCCHHGQREVEWPDPTIVTRGLPDHLFVLVLVVVYVLVMVAIVRAHG